MSYCNVQIFNLPHQTVFVAASNKFSYVTKWCQLVY